MTVLWPNGSTTTPRVTSEFDAARKNPVTGVVQPHNGIDLVGWTDNVAPVSGTVIFAGYNGGAGNEVRIQGDDGNFYRILHHASLYVRTGQRVAQGQAVGRMGTTGQSTGVHTHFETHYRWLWNYQNPRTFVANANSSAAGGGGKPFEEDDMYTDDDRRRDEKVAAFIDFMDGFGIRNGIPDRDLSRSKLEQAIMGAADTNFRLMVRDEGGTPVWDAFQELLQNVRALLVYATSAGDGVVDVEKLAIAIREGLGEDVVSELSKRLAQPVD